MATAVPTRVLTPAPGAWAMTLLMLGAGGVAAMADGAEGESGGGELLAGLGGGITGHGGDWHSERLGDLKGAARRRVGTSLALGKPVRNSAVGPVGQDSVRAGHGAGCREVGQVRLLCT